MCITGKKKWIVLSVDILQIWLSTIVLFIFGIKNNLQKSSIEKDKQWWKITGFKNQFSKGFDTRMSIGNNLGVDFCVCHQFYGNVADDNFNHRLELNDPQKNHISSKIGSEDVAFPS